MCRETAQCLRVWKNCCGRISLYISFIYADQSIQHIRIFQQITVGSQFVFGCCTIQKFCENFRSESQVQKQIKLVRQGLQVVPGTKIIPFSAQTKQGREEIWELIDELTGMAEQEKTPEA